MGRCDCWATVVLVGPRVAVAAAELLEYVGRQPVIPDAPIFLSAGPIAGGALLRAASGSAELMLRFFREHLGFLAALCGDDPWGRKG
jgi:hypothetical protein